MPCFSWVWEKAPEHVIRCAAQDLREAARSCFRTPQLYPLRGAMTACIRKQCIRHPLATAWESRSSPGLNCSGDFISPKKAGPRARLFHFRWGKGTDSSVPQPAAASPSFPLRWGEGVTVSSKKSLTRNQDHPIVLPAGEHLCCSHIGTITSVAR